VDDATRAALLDQAGRAARMNADHAVARDRLQRAVEIFEGLGDHESAARSLLALAQTLWHEDRLDEAIELNRRALGGLPEGGPEKAAALAALAGNLTFSGAVDEALEAVDAALRIAEPLEEWRTIVDALATMGNLRVNGRFQEATAFMERALALSLAHDLTSEAIRQYGNLANIPLQRDRFAEALEQAERGLALAESRGERTQQATLALSVATARVALGRWDDLPPLEADTLPGTSALLRLGYLPLVARVQSARGDAAGLERTLSLAVAAAGSTNVEWATGPLVARAIALRGLGRDAEALAVALPIAIGGTEVLNEDRREAYVEAGLAALALGDETALERLIAFVAELPPATRSPLLRSGAARFAGLLASRRGDARAAGERLAAAARELDEVEAPFNLAQVQLEHAEVLVAAGHEDEAAPLLAAARATFERLGAAPWLARADDTSNRVAV
jgi:tetratricopeptide (TPR) repeat protein